MIIYWVNFTSSYNNNFFFFSVFFFLFWIRFDFDSQTISPPAHDESFFYIRYPTGTTQNDKKPTTSSNSLKSSISDAITKQQLDTKTNSSKALIEKKNMVQHTEPCKQFLNQKERGKSKHFYKSQQMYKSKCIFFWFKLLDWWMTFCHLNAMNAVDNDELV